MFPEPDSRELSGAGRKIFPEPSRCIKNIGKCSEHCAEYYAKIGFRPSSVITAENRKNRAHTLCWLHTLCWRFSRVSVVITTDMGNRILP